MNMELTSLKYLYVTLKLSWPRNELKTAGSRIPSTHPRLFINILHANDVKPKTNQSFKKNYVCYKICLFSLSKILIQYIIAKKKMVALSIPDMKEQPTKS